MNCAYQSADVAPVSRRFTLQTTTACCDVASNSTSRAINVSNARLSRMPMLQRRDTAHLVQDCPNHLDSPLFCGDLAISELFRSRCDTSTTRIAAVRSSRRRHASASASRKKLCCRAVRTPKVETVVTRSECDGRTREHAAFLYLVRSCAASRLKKQNGSGLPSRA